MSTSRPSDGISSDDGCRFRREVLSSRFQQPRENKEVGVLVNRSAGLRWPGIASESHRPGAVDNIGRLAPAAWTAIVTGLRYGVRVTMNRVG